MSEPRPIYSVSPSTLGEWDGGEVLSILSHHIGRSHAISRTELLRALSLTRFEDRHLRDQIRQLRRLGHLIGSASGLDGGYYLIETQEEFNEFMTTEFLAKIKDMSETVGAMNRAAQTRFSLPAYQPALF